MDEPQVTLTPGQQQQQQRFQPGSPPCPDPDVMARHRRQRSSVTSRPNAAARHAKRLTLNFPISVQPALYQNHNQSPSETSSSSPAQAQTPLRPFSSGLMSPPHLRTATMSPSNLTEPPGDGGGQLLTAIAAQERKVLELREELHKAEVELVSLKRQWAVEEKGKKNTQIVHHAEALKPLRQSQLLAQEEGVSSGDGDMRRSIDAQQARMSVDLRRQNSISRSSIDSPVGGDGMSVSARGRTVFQSSRHARTLSLLSSASVPNQKPVAPVENVDLRRGARYPRSATLPSMERHGNARHVANSTATASPAEKAMWRNSLPPVAQDPTADALVRTGRQMVSDFREGLWTFVEDLRQATVGDDSVTSQGQLIRRASGQGSASSSRERSTASRTRATANGLARTSSSGKTPTATHQEISFWSEFGIDAPEQTQPASGQGRDQDAQTQKSNGSNLLDFDDSWDDWDAPPPPSQQKTHTPSSSSSTFPKRDQSPCTNESSPRTSTRSVGFTLLFLLLLTAHSLTDIMTSQKEPPPETNNNSNSSSSSKRDSIPWPALNKLHPSKLTRTASNLMDEWERSLASPDSRPSQPTTPDPSKTE